MKLLRFPALVFVVLMLSGSVWSCKKDAGEGGTSTISGKVLVYKYDIAYLQPEDTFSGVGENVYIIYGGNKSTYDNKYSTTYDGTFEFKYLQKGDYKLFAYMDDTTGAYNGTLDLSKPKIPVFVDVHIGDNGTTVTSPVIHILKNH